MMIKVGALTAKLAVVSGTSLAAWQIGGVDLHEFIEPKHAGAILAGLLSSLFIHIVVIFHKEHRSDVAPLRIFAGHVIAIVPNFVMAWATTLYFAGKDPPIWAMVVLLAMLIGATGTKAIKIAGVEFLRRLGSEGEKN